MLAERTQTPTVLDILGDRYQILGRIAEGGMGSVYLGRQMELGRHVAIKTLHAHASGNHELSERFRREAEAVKQLTHPNTIRIYDFGQSAGGWLYLVMEFLEGLTLDKVLEQRGMLSIDTVTRIGVQVLKSLVEAHFRGIVHRDLKPSNIMLCRQLGERDFVKVLDFGLARVDLGGQSFKTRTGASLGTPHYMSPEQVRGESPDGRSDLYSLALALYELVTGMPAYDGPTLYEVALKHVKPGVLALPRELSGTRLGAVIAKAAHKRPDDRYQTALDMLRALTGDVSYGAPSLLDEMGYAPPPAEEVATPVPMSRETQHDASPLAEAARGRRRRKHLLMGGGALSLALVVAALYAAVAPSADDGVASDVVPVTRVVAESTDVVAATAVAERVAKPPAAPAEPRAEEGAAVELSEADPSRASEGEAAVDDGGRDPMPANATDEAAPADRAELTGHEAEPERSGDAEAADRSRRDGRSRDSRASRERDPVPPPDDEPNDFALPVNF